MSSLDDDELHHYGEIAADQKRLEWRYGWAQIACVAVAFATFVWVLRDYAVNGLTWRGGVLVGLTLALGYWPYRKAIVRRLWGRHCRAVRDETELRRQRKMRT